MESAKTFSIWKAEIHQLPDQLKRITSAKSAKVTPASIDQETMTGTFPGSGANPYLTTLDSCTCGDFRHRKLPCKHIYRLAIELGMLDESAENGVNKNTLKAMQLSLEDAVGILENLTDQSQNVIKVFLMQNPSLDTEFPVLAESAGKDLLQCPLLENVDYPLPAFQVLKRRDIMETLDQHGIKGFKRNMSIKALADWCLENAPDVSEFFPKAYVFRFSASFQDAQKKTGIYLRRKYDWQRYYHDEQEVKYPYGSKPEDVTVYITFNENGESSKTTGNPDLYHFPDDKITKLLTLYGHNRCLNGYLALPDADQ